MTFHIGSGDPSARRRGITAMTDFVEELMASTMAETPLDFVVSSLRYSFFSFNYTYNSFF